ncbi:hypothetical protein QVH35_04520 [Candidatus Nitrosotenuis chungbukensis]|uniref:hypothetical protein n=1 Tax=Candidatus Nitrosotenuis chungbukensis TaxID=1353246 RepID=UPI00267400F8|nr:hypothetical protein [Candidatus Nitrosotenuis chungbukensis]WKT58638.1 hypothetical protein QVH35_04520 [Candidatus Nitrosotenuis chungbukensis]
MIKSIRIPDALIIIAVIVSFSIMLYSYEEAEQNLKEILLQNQIEPSMAPTKQ